ncbi:MAG TPA: hypothetical protein VMG38_04875 [Trebonia sp.]|nr:hypothetical protein [Trebonia sp.]
MTGSATAAYRLAWADGELNHFHWDLKAARELLVTMGAPIPQLASVDPATVKIGMEDDILALIAKLRARSEGS